MVWITAPLVVVLLMAVTGVLAFQAGSRSATTTGAPPAPTTGTAGPPAVLKAQPVDVGFAADMIDHHDQAVQMSLLAIGKATTPAVRQLAVEIMTAQSREGGMLLQFLRDRGVDQVDPGRTVMVWMNEPTPADQMPGLATQAELLALTTATGDETDRLFVELMIRHHVGGVHMAEFAAAHAETQDLRDLAAKMVVDQNHEITDLQTLQPPG